MRSAWLYTYAERYVERFTGTPCSEKLVTTHNVSLRIREDLGPGLLHASPAELPTHNNRDEGDYSCKNLEKWERSIAVPVSSADCKKQQLYSDLLRT